MSVVSVGLDRLNELEESRKYLVKNISILMKNYPETYVAIVDGHVSLSDPDLDSLLEKVKQKCGSTRGVLIEYITPKQSEIVV